MSEITVPFLSEHQAPDSTPGKDPGYNPPEDVKKTIRMVESLYGKAKKYRKRYDQRWIDFYKMFRGRQWKEVRPSYRSSEVINLIFETIQSMVPILVDSKPKLEFLPTVATQYELADILSKVAASDWDHNNWLITLIEIIYDAHFYGTGLGYIGHDPEADMGLGSICFESQDPFYFYPDPSARDINGRRTGYVINAEPEPIEKVKKEFPNAAPYIKGDVVDFAHGDKADIYQVMFKSPVDSKLIVEGPSGYDSIAHDQCLKITLYSKDDTAVEEKELVRAEDGTPTTDDSGEPLEKFVQRKKYPKGRKVVVASGVLCFDSETDDPEAGIGFDDGLFPHAKLVNYQLPREFWGVGEVENLESPQKTINKILACALDCMSLMGNPIFIVDDTANLDTDNLFNKPGLIIEKTAGSEVRREPGVELPSYLLPLVGLYQRLFNGVSGTTDISRGVEPAGVTAASAIASLQEAQQTRLRLKSKHIDAFLQDFGKLYLSRVFQFYSVPRIVRVSGNENADKYFYFHIEKLDGADGNSRPVANITYPDGSAKQIEIEGDFDVRVATGSSLPFAKAQKSDMAMKLFQLQVIDDEELLKSLDYPNYESVLQRVAQKKAQTQQAQMQMQQAMGQAKVQESMAKAQKTGAEAAITTIEAQTLAQTPPLLRGNHG